MVPELEIRRVQDGSRLVLVARGDIDMATVERLRAALEEATGSSDEIWVDLTEVEFMDSSGLNALVVGHHASELTVVCPSGHPARRALEVSGLHNMLQVRASRDGRAAHESAP